MLGVGLGSLTAYLKAKEMPRVEIIIKLAEIGGLSVDDLLKSDKPPEKKELTVTIGGKATVGVGVVSGDFYGNVYQNTTVKKTFKYTYQPGDLTEAQAARLQQLVEEIVNLENTAKRAPRSYAAVWNALKKKFKVAYYRKIREEDFEKAEAYLKIWKGRLMSSRQVRKKDNDLYRKERYKGIFTVATKELGWRKADVDNFIFEEYGRRSIRDLTDEELERLYKKVFQMKR